MWRTRIHRETTSFSSPILNEQQLIIFHFDRQMKLISKKWFATISNFIVSVDKRNPYRSLTSSGHQLIIRDDHFHTIYNIRLEFNSLPFFSLFLHYKTHLIFLTPCIEELHVNREYDDWQLLLGRKWVNGCIRRFGSIAILMRVRADWTFAFVRLLILTIPVSSRRCLVLVFVYFQHLYQWEYLKKLKHYLSHRHRYFL